MHQKPNHWVLISLRSSWCWSKWHEPQPIQACQSVRHWYSWWRAGCPPCSGSPWCYWGESLWWACTWTPVCTPCGSFPTGMRRWWDWPMSCCMLGSGRSPGTRTTPGWVENSQTPPTSRPHDGVARKSRRPRPPPALSEQSVKGEGTRHEMYKSVNQHINESIPISIGQWIPLFTHAIPHKWIWHTRSTVKFI